MFVEFYCNTIFRDVKPANLLLKTSDHLVLTDFGSAVIVPVEVGNSKESQELKDEHAELCTMPYRAPELFNCDVGEVYDDRVDTWVSYLAFGNRICIFKPIFTFKLSILVRRLCSPRPVFPPVSIRRGC
jgi:serine/threonine protein kinase